jgi:ATP-dependent Lhr-like helicase
MEARGEIRGGRFVAGVGGEQFANADVITQLRATNEETESLRLPATDPLNLSGRLGGSTRIPAMVGNTIVVSNGTIHNHSSEVKSHR